MGREGGMGGSVVCFGQQRRGHGAGLGADRQQQVMGGKKKPMYSSTKMYFPF